MTHESSRERNERTAVLVIDDSDIDRLAMVDTLANAGFVVHGLPTPIGATRAARELKARVVVIDQNLPAMDGSKLAALFRGNAAMRDVRVILVSGNEDEAIRATARAAQVDAFLSKRNIATELVPLVRRLAQ